MKEYETEIGNKCAWIGLGIPAILAWIVLGFSYLINPHLANEIDIWKATGGAVTIWYVAVISTYATANS